MSVYLDYLIFWVTTGTIPFLGAMLLGLGCAFVSWPYFLLLMTVLVAGSALWVGSFTTAALLGQLGYAAIGWVHGALFCVAVLSFLPPAKST